MLQGQFCEEVLSTAVCTEQWFGFLEVFAEARNWRVEISHCPAYSETQHGAVSNELRVVASTNVHATWEHQVGAVVLRFENTTAPRHTHWAYMAAKRECSMLCLRQDGRRNVYMSVLSIKCPEWGTRGAGMPDLSMCGRDPPSMALLPAGETVTAAESMREGERCEWRPVGVAPPSPPMWQRISGRLADATGVAVGPLLICALVGAKTAMVARELRRRLPAT